MKHILQHKITQPCHETWEQMMPTPRGRYCFACRKEVIDLSEMTDNEIALFLYQQQGNSFCSRMTEVQTQKQYEYIQPVLNQSPVKKYVALFLAGLAVTTATAEAQMTHPIFQISQPVSVNLTKIPSSLQKPKGTKVISGRLIDSDSKMPLRNVAISLHAYNIMMKLQEDLAQAQSRIEEEDINSEIWQSEVTRIQEELQKWESLQTQTDDEGYFSFVLLPETPDTQFMLAINWTEPQKNAEGEANSYSYYLYPAFTIDYNGQYVTQEYEVKKKLNNQAIYLGGR